MQPLHGRWLSPRHLCALGLCLSPPEPYSDVRSERQAGRIAFAHYLAESLALVATAGPYLKPTPTALTWLEQPASAQLRDLWQAWLSPADENHELWRRYRLPGHKLRDPIGFARRLIHLLAEQPAAADLDWARLDALVPWWETDHQTGRALAQAILAGPLRWLGIVHPSVAPPSPALTSIGAWLLEQPGAPPPNDEAQPLTLAPDLTLHLAPRPRPAGLLALAHWADLEPGPVAHRPCLRLSSHSIAHAWERGGRLLDLLAALKRHTAPPLSPAQRDTLRAWFEQIAAVTVQPFLLLQTPTGEEMDRLWRQPAIRSHLGRRIAPDLAAIETSAPETLVRALRRQGLAIQAPSPLSPVPPTNGAPLSPGEAEWLLVSSLIHNHLSRQLGLTAVPPAALRQTLAAALDPARLAAAQAAAERAIARLQQTLDGPAPVPPALPLEDLVERLEASIHAGQRLHLRYWSAARGEITERQIEPHHIEWRGDHAYLVAHCHLRDAERTFRLDRILEANERMSE